MLTLLRFLLRNHVFIVFLLLEGLCLFLIQKSSYYQQAEMLSVFTSIKGSVYNKGNEFYQYLSLREDNEKLQQENTALRNELEAYKTLPGGEQLVETDSTGKLLFKYISATIINSTVNQQHNMLWLNVGRKHGVEPEMGVISPDGVIGRVSRVTDNYSEVVSILNIDFRVSGKLENTKYMGRVYWDGKNYREVLMIDVPQHADLKKGEKVVTSGSSLIYPNNIPIGTVDSFVVKNGNSYEIKILLQADFKKLDQAYVVNFLDKNELKELGASNE